MGTAAPCILALNVGSATIRYALFEAGESLRELARDKLDGVVLSNTISSQLLDALEQQLNFTSIKALGHRIVHGMAHTQPEHITAALLTELRSLVALAPEHLPRQLDLIAEVQSRYPQLPQVACFDTAFHHTLPRVAKLLAIPRQFQGNGIERYGFHGLSYSWLLHELQRSGDPAAIRGRVVMAHLGGGASMAAILNGQCIDTSMGFTPNAGLMMSTRCGDLDPGLVSYLIGTKRMSVDEFDHMVTRTSGLLGVSETSGDMRELLSRENHDARAAEAIELFCYQARKYLGAYTSVLGGIDCLVFTGGIGENAPQVRHRICANLGYLGIEIDDARNQANSDIISPDVCRVRVRVIPTNEEMMIARSVAEIVFANPEPGAL